MPQRVDHRCPLSPDVSLAITLDAVGKLHANDVPPEGMDVASITWMLAVDYRATKRWRSPWVTVWQGERRCFRQYLKPREEGARLVNLTGISTLYDIRVQTEHCQLSAHATLLGFIPPDFAQGPLLVLAPHPDDAELAAYGLYQRHAANSWIVTLTAGERQKSLDQQYLPRLDKSVTTASRRKGEIRAWNSATTPLWAGVEAEQLVMLGYFNDTLAALLKSPKQEVNAEWLDDEVTPAAFRRYNRFPLPSDAHNNRPRNSGDALLKDLTELIERIRPSTVVVTHPEIDPHSDHQATARALALALYETHHQPNDVLLYANHLKSVRGFPRGPAHAAAGVWPINQPRSALGPWRLYSEVLSDAAIREKAVALHTMHDLHVPVNLDKRVKRWFSRRLSGLPAHAWKDYGPHDYFQTHLKAHEVFARVDAATFVAALTDGRFCGQTLG